MNKQSNTYTIIYIIVLVLVVGSALALTAMALKPRQQENADADKKRQILAAVHITADPKDISSTFDKYITDQFIVDEAGERVGDDAFAVNVANESKTAPEKRELPVYVCTLADKGETKYILPVYGAGLWGPIWGYVALDSDGSTVYGAYFAHQGETPGLGAEIEKPAFSDQFEGKQMFKGDKYLPVTVVKAGQKPLGDEDYVDAVSGGTITSKGVAAMLNDCLTPYKNYLETLRNK
ncbi:MAG: NADH:ubiquinone reductase (Na(+)-transporting) subunit C [Muribaculaceae bacterium]|nr:NADH:ubiquinone reductase (Na(+)-transporting) subunit C [Muribaculaceae bacterium]MDE5594003.1 NADH:ubiquinone reductase (Na(+)-transporting) subunit C [Muribaculaceae bacterium]